MEAKMKPISLGRASEEEGGDEVVGEERQVHFWQVGLSSNKKAEGCQAAALH